MDKLQIINQICDEKLVETVKNTYPSYQEYRMAEVDLLAQKRFCIDILEVIQGY
jgi:hypothetical protein